MLEMPQEVAKDAYMAETWRRLTAAHAFTETDAPNLALLCFWHAVAKSAEDSMSKGKSIKVLDRVGYKPIKAKNGRYEYLEKPHPAVTVLKQATAEIRALNDTLGISKKASAPQPVERKGANGKLLTLMFDERERKAKAAGA